MRLLWGITFIAGLATAASASQLTFPDFSNVSGLTLNGRASVVQDGIGKALRIIPAQVNQFGVAGSAFANGLVDTGQFVTTFQFQETNTFSEGDGFTFEIQSVSPSLIGGGGGGLGYGGNPGVAVEFDNHQNTEFADAPAPHLGIDTGGNLVSVATASPSSGFNDGNIWFAKIVYSGGQISVWANETGDFSSAPLLAYNIDLQSQLGQETGYVGFTGGSGFGYANEDIQNWTFTSSTPEPGAVAILAIASFSVAVLRPPAAERN